MSTFVLRTAKNALGQYPVAQERVVGALLGALSIADVRTGFLFVYVLRLINKMFPGEPVSWSVLQYNRYECEVASQPHCNFIRDAEGVFV